MLSDKNTNLVHLLSQPHRISNPRAMMKAWARFLRGEKTDTVVNIGVGR